MPDLSGLVTIITGAGSGIGRSAALRMADCGSAIMCADIDGEAAKTTAAQIAEHRGRASAIQLDVSDEAAVKAALQKTVEELGALDVIVNNAGIGGAAMGWERTIAVNLSGVYNGLFHGAALLAERGGGSIINTASVAGLVGLTSPATTDIELPVPEGAGAYVAAKHGVVGLTRQFAVTYGRRGVRVNAVAPGYIVTPMTSLVRSAEEYEAYITELHPMGRMGQPEEVAAAITFLASKEASFITGVILPVDGGYTAR
ncbi:MAG: SDR family NAD(P)-dependent oxidoreductase [Tepidiformaceae bacterium]